MSDSVVFCASESSLFLVLCFCTPSFRFVLLCVETSMFSVSYQALDEAWEM